jgi:hypothetical protein
MEMDDGRGRHRTTPGAVSKTKVLAVALAVVGVATTPALAHEDAVLASNQSSVGAGTALTVRGSDFTAEESYKLRLLGALTEYDLVEVKADTAGAFALDVAIPLEARPGAYQVVAIAPDGDAVARLDVTVLEAAATPMESMQSPRAGEEMAHSEQMARAEEISIERNRSGIEWGFIGLIVGGAGGLGIGLLGRRRAA